MKRLLFSILLLLPAAAAFACSCIQINTFCESIVDQDGNLWQGYQIYQIRVTQNSDAGIKVRVEKTFAGIESTGQELFFVNGQGADCKRHTSDFGVGKSYIISAWWVDEVWAVPLCGIGFLAIEDGKVKGPIAPGISEIALEAFPSILDCGNLQNPTGENPTGGNSLEIAVYPTVSAQSVTLEIKNREVAVDIEIEVFDASGRLVQRIREWNFTGDLLPLDLQARTPGLYFMRVSISNRRETFRIMKS